MKTVDTSATRFWKIFQEAESAAPATAGASEWTLRMYAVLHDVRKTLGNLYCICGPGHIGEDAGNAGERFRIDLTWYPNDAAAGDFDPPLVAIEHENKYGFQDANWDWWKLNQIAVPLRVFVGYTRTASAVPGRAHALATLARKSRWRNVTGGETLLVLGFKGMEPGRFRAWRLDAALHEKSI
jgi:hypothetical protein